MRKMALDRIARWSPMREMRGLNHVISKDLRALVNAAMHGGWRCSPYFNHGWNDKLNND
jgi:hypothetical protein